MAQSRPYVTNESNHVAENPTDILIAIRNELVHFHPEWHDEQDRHVSGQQLCLGLRDFAIERYGLLARRVLEHWNIRRTDDFGRIVYHMIEAGLMTRQDDDQIEDFFGVYDFNVVFDPESLLPSIDSEDPLPEQDFELIGNSTTI